MGIEAGLEGVKTHCVVKLEDKEDSQLIDHFHKTNAFLAEQLKSTNVLVHCHQGVSRSATVIIAYLMHKNRWTVEEALKYAKAKRDIVNPNVGFLQ